MRRLLDYAEEEIARRIREGAKMAVEALSAALTEEPKAESIREISSRIHELHYEISDLVMEAVARYSPVATDLRFLKGALFVSYDIYRVARYAYDIAVVVEKLGSGCWSRRVVEVGEVVKRMVSTSVEMFLNKDISRLKEVEELDDNVVDKAYESSLVDVLRGADRCKVMETVVLRLLERASDHAVYIANHAYYLVTGQVKRH
ncbi:phosphate signaling complex PhoU family protein [Pyrobaculum aerophilum]|uniref:Phosphate transport system regulator, conjectural n=2 Tax=Pyrobaculum aerophilum TaxID=13773 RepID=Q8ZX98_PYRAE|nr:MULTISPECIES: phosphate uptake regulator PhoU [Pyrobaculum]AAL63451.1 phosphate transport system regulator, conjectural [Pyrobaculum aerophilum str. IM2]RFA95756.1 PhoU family transcriptional regulator [Pyrobaculum aerophilum]RFA99081.1 PhoU family transcriptional regulator [Pyrobaculum aerophilum]HII45952.1 phosphate uptake regulator PhoU [Pyrobaculum aerophilum]